MSEIKNQIQNAIGAHGKWKLRLSTAINTGNTDANVGDVAKDNLCEFGKWLYSSQVSIPNKNAEYEIVKKIHADFHKTASQILKLALDGKKDEANAIMKSTYSDISNNLASALMKWQKTVQ